MLVELGKTKDGCSVSIDPYQLLKERLLIQGTSGSGKTQTLIYVTEIMKQNIESDNKKDLPVIFFNWEGERTQLEDEFNFEWVGDKSEPTTHRQIELEKAYEFGAFVRQKQLSVIIDLSVLLNHDDRAKYVAEFIRAFLDQKQKFWYKCLVIIDEAHLLCNQTQWSESRDAIVNICETGRKRGICTFLVTQRLAEIHKNASASCTNRLIGNCVELNDRKLASQMLGISMSDNIDFAKLEQREFFGFGRAIVIMDKDENPQATQTVKFMVNMRTIPKIAKPMEQREIPEISMESISNPNIPELVEHVTEPDKAKPYSIEQFKEIIKEYKKKNNYLNSLCIRLASKSVTNERLKELQRESYVKGWNDAQHQARSFYILKLENQFKTGLINIKKPIILIKEMINGCEVIDKIEKQK